MNSPSFVEPPEGMSEGANILRMALSVLLIVTFIGLVIGWFSSVEHEKRKPHGLPDCGGDVSSTCLELRPGEFDPSGWGRPGRYTADLKNHHFEAEDGERDRVRLKISGYTARSLQDEKVAGIYHAGDLIGLEEEDGNRIWAEPGLLALPPLWFLGITAVLVLFMAGCVKVINRINAGVSKQALAKTQADQEEAIRRGLRRFGIRR